MGLGSEIRYPEKSIPDPGVKKAPDAGSESATLFQTRYRTRKLSEYHESQMLLVQYSNPNSFIHCCEFALVSKRIHFLYFKSF
jgi:hypothetical protein